MHRVRRTLHFAEKEEGELSSSDGEDVCSSHQPPPLMKDASTSTTDLDNDHGNTWADTNDDDDSTIWMNSLPVRAADIFGPLPLYLMDFQGFEGLDHQFIVKEMAILEHNDEHHMKTRHYFFKQPYPETMLNIDQELLDNNCTHYDKHGLRWSGNGAGQKHLPYSALERIVCETVGSWLLDNKDSEQPIKIFVYGYEKIAMLKAMLQLENKENVDYVDLSSHYLYNEKPNLELLLKNGAAVYCPEHYLLNFMETLRMKLSGDNGAHKILYCALNVVLITHAWIMQTMFKDKDVCKHFFKAIKNKI